MTQRQGRALLGSVAGRSAAGGLLPSDTVNIIQQLGPSYNFGGIQGVDAADLIILLALTTLGARYTSFRLTLTGTGGLTGSGYTVPAGRQLIIGKLLYVSPGAGGSIVIGYGDTSVDDAAGAPTAAVGLTPSGALVALAANTLYELTIALKVPAGKIPYLYSVGDNPDALVIGKLFNA